MTYASVLGVKSYLLIIIIQGNDKIKSKVMYNNYGKSYFNYGWKQEIMEPELVRQQVKEYEVSIERT